MVNMLIFSRFPGKINDIKAIALYHAARMTDDKWNIITCETEEELGRVGESEILDLICFEINTNDDVSYLETIRASHKKAYIMLIADIGISPICYLKPSVMAASLLLNPFTQDDLTASVKGLIDLLNLEEKSESDVFSVTNQDGKQRIPYDKLLFFEARDKKIYACTQKMEYGFYDSFEHLTEILPDFFIRCHRGFVINSHFIEKVRLSDGIIYLRNGTEIPISRSYRAVIKEWNSK